MTQPSASLPRRLPIRGEPECLVVARFFGPRCRPPWRKVLLASENLVLLYLKKLHAESTSGRVRVTGRVAVALLMLGLWLGLIGLSVSERFHHALHADASHADHDCLVVGFAKSLVLRKPSAGTPNDRY